MRAEGTPRRLRKGRAALGWDGRELLALELVHKDVRTFATTTIFNSADVAVVTKMDLAPAVEFDWNAAYGNIQAVRPGMTVLKASAKTEVFWRHASMSCALQQFPVVESLHDYIGRRFTFRCRTSQK